MFIVYTTLVFLNAHLIFARQQWVDPHDMNIKDANFVPKTNNPTLKTQQGSCDCSVPINFSISHYKRLINLLLTAVETERSDTVSYKGRLFVNMPAESYDFLKSFASDTQDIEDSAKLRKIDQILSKALAKPLYEHLMEALASWSDRIYFTFYNRTSLIFLSCLFVLFISYKLLRANLTIWAVVKYLIFLGWLTDFAFTWMNLLQEAEINKMADSLMYESMPPYCNPNKMSIWQYMMYSISSTSECRKYHQTVFKDHFWSVAPVTVLSHQFGILIYTPASLIGQALGTFTSGLLGSLPWGVNIILLPALLIFSAIILCIIFSFITQTSFGFNFLHVVQLEFGNEQRRVMGDVLSGQNLSAILNLAQRNMIEEVKQQDIVNSGTENSNCSNANENVESLVVKAEGSTSRSSKQSDLKLKEICDADDCLSCDKNEAARGYEDQACSEGLANKNKEVGDAESSEGGSKSGASREVLHDGSGDKL